MTVIVYYSDREVSLLYNARLTFASINRWKSVHLLMHVL